MSNCNDNGAFWKGLAVGSLFGVMGGVVAGWLTAPKSGEELRQDLREYYQAMSTEIASRLKDLQQATRESYNALVDTVADTYAKAKSIDKRDLEVLKTSLKADWDKFVDRVEKKA